MYTEAWSVMGLRQVHWIDLNLHCDWRTTTPSSGEIVERIDQVGGHFQEETAPDPKKPVCSHSPKIGVRYLQ